MIFLIGMTNAGKSCTGKCLAQKLSLPFIDIDSIIEKKLNMSVREFFLKEGNTAFRKIEYESFWQVIKNFHLTNTIVSTGGGIADNYNITEILKKQKCVILIDTPPHLIFERIKINAAKRGSYPAFLGKGITEEHDAKRVFYEIYKRRIKIYKNIASICIKSKNFTFDFIADEIAKTLKQNTL